MTGAESLAESRGDAFWSGGRSALTALAIVAAGAKGDTVRLPMADSSPPSFGPEEAAMTTLVTGGQDEGRETAAITINAVRMASKRGSEKEAGMAMGGGRAEGRGRS